MIVEVGVHNESNKNRIKAIDRKITEINNLLKSIYEDKVTNVISQETFMMLSKDYENQKNKLLKQLEKDAEITVVRVRIV